MLTQEIILSALGAVMDPDFNKSIVELGFVQNIKISGDESAPDIFFDLVLTTPTCPVKDEFVVKCKKILSDLGAKGVEIRLSASNTASSESMPSFLGGVKKIIAVASGKGGVGKSTVTANLAMSLALSGKSVGVLDADLYGPSMGILFGIKEPPEINECHILTPNISHGVKVATLAQLFPPEQANIWRGPRAAQMIKNLLHFVNWGELDVLLIDFPPGTGDIQLSVIQGCNLFGAVIVCTPQEVALADCRKGIALFKETNIPVLGVIENMSYFICDGCQKKHFIFNSGGAELLAQNTDIPFLGKIPLESSVSMESDKGLPIVLSCPNSESARAFAEISKIL